MQKRAIKPGFWGTMSSNVSYLDWLDLTKYIHDVLHVQGLPVYNDCCIAAPSASDIGKVLTVAANGFVLSTLAGGGIGTNVFLDAINATGIQVNSSTGTGLTLPLATSINSGLLSPSQFTKLSTLSGTNTGDVTITDSSSVDFTLTGQNITAVISGSTTATNGQIPSSNGTGGIIWSTIASKEKLDYIVPTALNTIPNLTSIPADPTKVKFYVNGLLERGITSNGAGIVSVNSGILGYNIDTQDLITANYLI